MAKAVDFDHKKVKYSLGSDGKFIIENYNFSKPLSSFFPGIAGLYGIPMWVFYVNRGQGICSFGTNSKDQPILEFLPANKAYQMASSRCFRTFIKVKSGGNFTYYEPFQNTLHNLEFKKNSRMIISFSDLSIEEENKSLGLEVKVNYFTIPSDNFAGLVRILSIKNVSNKPKSLELIDGLPIIIPYGLSNMFLKKLTRTIEAWMGVENLSNNVPFYRLKVDPTDRPEVVHVKKGNFYLSFYEKNNKESIINPIVDPDCVFGRVSDLSFPYLFLKDRNFKFPAKQIIQSKTPSAFSFVSVNLKKNQEFVLYSIFGNMDGLEKLNKNIKRITKIDYINQKKKENQGIIESLMLNALTVSSFLKFDLYAKGTFLDNVMRGGLPITLDKEREEVVYVYSRKHGDLERDYNKFVTQPTYFSQGNGNYRDINQNRRNDIFFNPELKEENILNFFNLIQLDGFNPLVIKGISYHIEDKEKISRLIKDYLVDGYSRDILNSFLAKPFYIGELFMFLEDHNIEIKGDKDGFIREVVSFSIKQQDAEHKEGFWTDHWIYNLDLVESYLSVYPEKLKYILLENKEFTFYDDYWVVNPRDKKYVLYGKHPRQLNSVAFCEEKQALIAERAVEPHKVRMSYGKGEIYKTNLIQKIICIIVNKLSSLDPFGTGIEMEANKPSWYDALNGLPALFGSSMPETMELKRLILFIRGSLESMGLGKDFKIKLAQEIFNFYNGLDSLLKQYKADSREENLIFWDKSYALKEEYRKQTLMGIDGVEKEISLSDFTEFLNRALEKVNKAIEKSYNPKNKTYSTYFINEVAEFEKIDNGKEGIFIKPIKFRQKILPLFLEGFVHALKIAGSAQERRLIHASIKDSPLYDKALGMYKVNASLDGQPEEIGRTKVFTPGWLENESIWLHMQYKYLLELLRGGLYDEFYSDFFKILIPFQDPQKYGRSILENSSFIVSSVFPDKELHGSGFVARLSGSTAELVHMWLLMNIGTAPFFLDAKGKLNLKFQPLLHKDLFTKNNVKINIGNKEVIIDKNCYAFNFLSTTLVVYHNPRRLNTYGKNSAQAKKIVLTYNSGRKSEINSDVITVDYSYDVRCGRVSRIDIHLS